MQQFTCTKLNVSKAPDQESEPEIRTLERNIERNLKNRTLKLKPERTLKQNNRSELTKELEQKLRTKTLEQKLGTEP